MKILISHVYSNHNKGDAALLSVLIGDIKRVFANSEITVLTLDKIYENEKFEGVPVINSFMYFARDLGSSSFTRALSGLFVLSYTFIWALFYRLFGIELKINSLVSFMVKKAEREDLKFETFVRLKPRSSIYKAKTVHDVS